MQRPGLQCDGLSVGCSLDSFSYLFGGASSKLSLRYVLRCESVVEREVRSESGKDFRHAELPDKFQ